MFGCIDEARCGTGTFRDVFSVQFLHLYTVPIGYNNAQTLFATDFIGVSPTLRTYGKYIGIH